MHFCIRFMILYWQEERGTDLRSDILGQPLRSRMVDLSFRAIFQLSTDVQMTSGFSFDIFALLIKFQMSAG